MPQPLNDVPFVLHEMQLKEQTGSAGVIQLEAFLRCRRPDDLRMDDEGDDVARGFVDQREGGRRDGQRAGRAAVRSEKILETDGPDDGGTELGLARRHVTLRPILFLHRKFGKLAG